MLLLNPRERHMNSEIHRGMSRVTALAGAIVALIAAPLAAQETGTGTSGEFVFDQTFTEDVSVTIGNTVQVNITKDLSVTKKLTFTGDVSISGSIGDISKAAFAVLDDKQIIDNSSATSRDANEAAIFGVVAVAGNIQLNAGTGALINQQNGGAVADTASTGRASADAEIFKLQNIFGNRISQSPGTKGTRGYDNYAAIYSLGGLVGTIQANAAAGSAVQQSNSFTIASASNTVLAEATAAVQQEISRTTVTQRGTENYAGIWDIVGLSGNVQVNVASGSAINQVNVLPIAHSAN